MLMRAAAVIAPACRRCPPRLDGKPCTDPRHTCVLCAGIGIFADYSVCVHPDVEQGEVVTKPAEPKRARFDWSPKTASKKRKGGKSNKSDRKRREEKPVAKDPAKKGKKKDKGKKKKHQLEEAQPLDLDELEPEDELPADANVAEQVREAEQDELESEDEAELAEPAEPAEPDAEEPVDEEPDDAADSEGDAPYGDDADDEEDYNPNGLPEIVSIQDMSWENFCKHLEGRHTEMFDKLKKPVARLSKAAQSSTRALHYRMHNANIMNDGAEHVHVPHERD